MKEVLSVIALIFLTKILVDSIFELFISAKIKPVKYYYITKYGLIYKAQKRG